MKKLLLSLTMLLTGIMAWAAPITELSDAVVGKVFTIRSKDRGAFVYNSAATTEYLSGSKKSDQVYGNNGNLDNHDKNFLFAFVKDGDKYFLYSIGAEKYAVYHTDNSVALSTEAPAAGVTLLSSTGDTKANFPTVIAIDGTNHLNMTTNQNHGIVYYNGYFADPGNMLAIEAVDGCVFNNETKAFTDNRISFTYKYTYDNNGTKKEIGTQTINGIVGNAYPTPSLVLPIIYATPSAPEGNISADKANSVIEIACDKNKDVEKNFPFKYFSSFDDITTWYAAKLHSNQNHYLYWNESAIAFTSNYESDNDAYKWAFVGDPINGFKVYNKLAGKDVMLDNSNPCSLSSTENTVIVYPSKETAAGGFALKFDGQTYLNYQSEAIKRWGDNDAGSTWLLTDLSANVLAEAAKAEALVTINASSILFGDPNTEGTLAHIAKTAIEEYTYDTTSETASEEAVAFYNTTLNNMCAAVDKDIVFYNTNRNNKYMVVTDAILLSGDNAANGTSIFNVKGIQGTNHFTIQNKANKRYIANTPATSSRIQLSLTAGEFTIKSFGTDNKFAFICTQPNNDRHNSLHLDGSHRVVAWEADNENNASVWVIEEPESTLSVEEGEIIVKTQALTPALDLKNSLGENNAEFGNGLGQYDDANAVSAFNNAMSAIPNAIDGYTFEDLLPLKDNLQATCNNLQIVQPNLKAFVISGKQTGRYISTSGIATEGDNANRIKMVTDRENADIFLLTDNNEMVSYTAGLGITRSEQIAPASTAINTMNFTKGLHTGYYTIATDYTGNPYMYDNQTKDVLCSYTGKVNNTDWTLTEVESLPIKMNAVGGAYYATFNAPVRVVIPAGLKAYSASEEGDVLNLTKVVEDGVLEANTPVILYSLSDVASLSISAENGTAATSNALSGTNQKTTVTSGENYVMGQNDGKVGFYKYTGTTMPAFKAYLPSTSEVRAFTFSFDDIETSISAIESENSNAVIYDLAGRRVQKADRGLYIVNGKKVMYN
ncbi:MAG: hypothetical protein NC080_02295 [Paraprevotella sp.]|nr:hypothetical protein [Paraprevotella sp.]